MRASFAVTVQRAVIEYRGKVNAFQPNARFFLLHIIISGAAMGVFRLLFNFFVLSLGYDEALLGNLVTASSFVALLAALPMGYTADWLGRKRALLVAVFLEALAILLMVAFPSAGVFLAMSALSGLGQSLAAVTVSPFLMENSSAEERTYLFSISSGLQMTMASVGNWIGGYLPGWLAAFLHSEATSPRAYGAALLIIGSVLLLSLLPLAAIRSYAAARSERTFFAPFAYFRQQPKLLARLIAPMFVTSIGAGLIMPFMNVFYRQVYHQSDPVIGALFAWGSLWMGVGLLLAPPLADRWGKMNLVIGSQALSIPFLILMGFAPQFWLSAFAYYIRLALMNMSSPVYQAFVMERVEPSARATVSSLVSMSWNFGWAFSPTISGWLQVRYGFAPAFIGTILLYCLSIYLYWVFFGRREESPSSATIHKIPAD
ncbi:MAG: MFS transporter [Anaerolineales bacterium]